MKQTRPALQITPLFRCSISYDCHPLAGEWLSDDSCEKYPYPEWGGLNDLVYSAAQKAGTSEQVDLEHFPGGAACWPYIKITAPTWALCKAMGDAVIRCILDNGGIVEPKDNGINI